MIKKKCVLNNDELISKKIISSGTGSQAIVYLVKEKKTPHKNYIIKQLTTQKLAPNLDPNLKTPVYNSLSNSPDNSLVNSLVDLPDDLPQYIDIMSEAQIYNNVMVTLVRQYITPYVIMGQGIINCAK